MLMKMCMHFIIHIIALQFETHTIGVLVRASQATTFPGALEERRDAELAVTQIGLQARTPPRISRAPKDLQKLVQKPNVLNCRAYIQITV